MTTVGSAGPLSDSYYGTADQGGNVWEWNEALINVSDRGLRGGSFLSFFAVDLRSSVRSFSDPSNEGLDVGFRVATVPEPSTAVLAIVGCVLMLWWRKRRK